MKAEELRIGNKIIANGLHEGREMTVEQIGSKGTMLDDVRVILFKEHHAGEFVKDCVGIPIAEEWLLKFGFEKVNHIHSGVYYFHRLYKISIFPNGTIELRGSVGWNKIQFVHQLQNLYYALTGEELTLTEQAKAA